MRSIFSLAFIVALALGGYLASQHFLDTAVVEQAPRVEGPSYSAPATERPKVGATSPGQIPGLVPNIPKELEERIAKGLVSWRDVVSEEYLIPMEAAWEVDLSAVDFTQETLCRVAGVTISREDLLRWMCLKYGQAVIGAKFFGGMGQMASEETGIAYGLTDAQWDIYFTDWLNQLGVDREHALAQLSMKTRIPMEHVEGVRRDMVEAVIACFPAVDSTDELPLGLGRFFSSEEERVNALKLGALMQKYSTERSANTGQVRAPMAALLDPMSALLGRAASEIRLRRTWTSLTHELPQGVLAAMYLGPLDLDGEAVAPWEYEGERLEVTTDQVWNMIGAHVGPELMEAELREVIWSMVLKAKLAEGGHLPSAGAAWSQFADEFMAHQASFFNLDWVLHQRGFPARSFYIDDQRIMDGFAAQQPAEWNSGEALRAYFAANGFFSQGWEPNLELALFVSRDPRKGADAPEDWEAALTEAQAFKVVVEAAGDFSGRRWVHNHELADAYRKLNQQVGDGFARELNGGEFSTRLRLLNQALRQDVRQDHIAGVSAIRNTVIRLRAGEVSPPWKTAVGYVVIRMNSARLNRLEREFEDVREAVAVEHSSWAFRKWLTRELSGLEVVVPQ